MQSYVKPEAVAGAQQRRVMTVLERGPTGLLSLKRLDRESFQTDFPEEKLSTFAEMNGIEPSAS